MYSSAMVEVKREAQKHLRCLIAGIDPRTRRPLTQPGVLADPKVLRSLALALDALAHRRTKRREAEKIDESRSCEPWSPSEDRDLFVAFRKQVGLDELSVSHGRSHDRIRTRLVHLGLVSSKQEADVIFRRQQQRLKAPV